jgi:alpha-glucosidase
MVSDSPSTYMKEQESMDFIASVPASWDDSKALDGKIGEYIVMARRKSNTWFLGALNNETPRSLTVDLSFLGNGKYKAFIYADGLNADKVGTDYKFTTQEVTRESSLPVKLATGGGYTVRFEQID